MNKNIFKFIFHLELFWRMRSIFKGNKDISQCDEANCKCYWRRVKCISQTGWCVMTIGERMSYIMCTESRKEIMPYKKIIY